MTENDVAKHIVDAAYRIHTTLGPGLLESVYEVVLAYELEKRGLRAARQQTVPSVYQGTRIEVGFRADLIVEDSVIVEIKSVEAIAPVHKKQLLTYTLGGQALGVAHQLQRRADQGRHHARSKRHAGLMSRKGAKMQRRKGARANRGPVIPCSQRQPRSGNP